MMASFSIASYNSNGFGQDRVVYISQLCKSLCFTLIQEHWLLEKQLDKFSNIPDICYHAVSGMPADTLLYGRLYGGCAIVWNVNFDGRVVPIQFLSNKLCGCHYYTW